MTVQIGDILIGKAWSDNMYAFMTGEEFEVIATDPVYVKALDPGVRQCIIMNGDNPDRFGSFGSGNSTKTYFIKP